MNGRIYDFNLGRFLSVDPFLQFPENSQSANPYSYILNNPMSGTDPTGYLSCSLEEDQSCLDKANNGESITIKDKDGKKVGTYTQNGEKNTGNGTVTFKSEGKQQIGHLAKGLEGGKGTNQSQQIPIGNAFNEFIGLPPEAKAAANDILENTADWLVIDDAKETINGITSGDGAAIAAGVVGLTCKPCKVADKLSDFAPNPLAKAVSNAISDNRKQSFLSLDGKTDALQNIRESYSNTKANTLDIKHQELREIDNLKRSEKGNVYKRSGTQKIIDVFEAIFQYMNL